MLSLLEYLEFSPSLVLPWVSLTIAATAECHEEVLEVTKPECFSICYSFLHLVSVIKFLSGIEVMVKLKEDFLEECLFVSEILIVSNNESSKPKNNCLETTQFCQNVLDCVDLPSDRLLVPTLYEAN